MDTIALALLAAVASTPISPMEPVVGNVVVIEVPVEVIVEVPVVVEPEAPTFTFTLNVTDTGAVHGLTWDACATAAEELRFAKLMRRDLQTHNVYKENSGLLYGFGDNYHRYTISCNKAVI